MSEKAPRIPVVVAEIEEITPLVKRFKLVPKSGEPLPTFAGGAHIAVEMQDGDIVRRNSYSLMSSPFDPTHYAISVRRDDTGRGGSLFLHQRVSKGHELFIGHPVNLFPMDRRARRHLLVAGGIGITPFVAMIEHFAKGSSNFRDASAVCNSRQEIVRSVILKEVRTVDCHVACTSAALLAASTRARRRHLDHLAPPFRRFHSQSLA